MRAEEFVSRLEKVRKSGNGWTALCPGHKDKKPSLSITEKAERILFGVVDEHEIADPHIHRRGGVWPVP